MEDTQTTTVEVHRENWTFEADAAEAGLSVRCIRSAYQSGTSFHTYELSGPVDALAAWEASQ